MFLVSSRTAYPFDSLSLAVNSSTLLCNNDIFALSLLESTLSLFFLSLRFITTLLLVLDAASSWPHLITLFLPLSFAAYKALSAWSNNCEQLSNFSELQTTPKLAVMETFFAQKSLLTLRMVFLRCSAMFTASSASDPGNTRQNSSPPYRPTIVFLLSQWWLSTSVIIRIASSPIACP